MEKDKTKDENEEGTMTALASFNSMRRILDAN